MLLKGVEDGTLHIVDSNAVAWLGSAMTSSPISGPPAFKFEPRPHL
jgi:hypothetical protein